MFRRTALFGVALGVLACGPLEAQDWKTVTSFRQRGDESGLDVHVRYGAGRLLIGPSAGSSELYRVGLRYDSDVFEPITRYSSGRLEVGVDGMNRSIKLKNHDAGELDLRLSDAVPLDLDFDFGAVEADLELGSLRIRSLDIETGASDTSLRFSRPNPVECQRLELSVGAASFEAEGLGNVGCDVLRVEGGVGDVTLDFSGDWRRDARAEIELALGSLNLVIPSDVGVRVDKDTFLMDFNGGRFTERDGVRYSDNWESARYRLTVDVSGAFGSINVRWRD